MTEPKSERTGSTEAVANGTTAAADSSSHSDSPPSGGSSASAGGAAGDTAGGRSPSEPERGVVTGNEIRRTILRVGVGLTAVAVVVMLGFILLDWLRRYPYADQYAALGTAYSIVGIDPYAGHAFEQFMAFGGWMDYYLGTDVFRFEFYWRSIATGVLIGVVAPLVGAFVVHREMALIGETLAHTAFAGIAVGLVLLALFSWWTAPWLLVALAVAVVGALAVQWLTAHTGSYGDVPIAIVLVGSFALGTILVEIGRDMGAVVIDIEALLFGNITIVPSSGARLMGVMSVAVLAMIAVAYKPLLYITFDEQAARVARIPVDRYNTALIVMTAVVVVGSMQILGVILVAAMLVVPVAAASQVSRSFRETMIVSVLIGELAIVAGFAVAFSFDLPPGGSIVLAAIACYVLAVAWSTRPTLSVR